MIIDADHMKRMECAKEFACTSKDSATTFNINYIDYSFDGCALITANDDETIELYNAQSGLKEKTVVVSKKYGLGCVKFVTESKTEAVHTSTKENNDIRLVALHGSKYLRYFRGHHKKVTGLSMSPVGQTFLSTSLDNCIRMWDTRSEQCQGVINCQGLTAGAFDPDGLVFAAGAGPGKVKLYDLRYFDKGAFLRIKDETYYNNVHSTSLEFSPSGRVILVNTDGDILYVYNSFTGEKMYTLNNIANDEKHHLQATFTPDSKFIWCGSSDGLIHCWETCSGKEIVSKKSRHKGMVNITRWNPKFFSMATAGSSVNFWICHDEEV